MINGLYVTVPCVMYALDNFTAITEGEWMLCEVGEKFANAACQSEAQGRLGYSQMKISHNLGYSIQASLRSL